jgi:DNA-binding LytR/AlgR family response regulator
MSNVKILIVEDESLVAMDMADMLTRLGYEVLSPAYSYEEATTRLEEEKPDFVLADINLGGGKTGIDLAHLVRSKYKLPLVFLTSYTDKETVAKAAATQPGGYLIKPFSQDELFASIEVALATFSGKKTEASEGFNIVNESLFVKTDAHFVKVNVADIQWLESDHNYLYIVTDKGKHIVRSSFREILSSLPAVPFMQIHKSFVVNLHKIDSFSHTEVVISKTAIPLSRNYKEELFEKLKRIQ